MEKIPTLIVAFERIKEMMALDLTGKIEQRLGLDYLAWADAELLLREHFPTFKVEQTLETVMRGEVAYVGVYSCIVDTETGKKTPSELFPVMDGSRARADIPNPGMRPISDAMKRAAVKVIARETGIGLPLYLKEKEDVPSESKLARSSDDADAPKSTASKLGGLKKLS